ncbi:MAG: glycosyltransferase family 2 protein [Candidatus Cloacimonetes bacterium]|nr:glycosyltransferase family 2 protein [Candidatus Cloacimonadota bacterium]
MLDVTGFVLTQNNERTLKACLDSLYWCDEIIVVDSFSTDTTEAIAKSYPKVRFLQHEYENYMEQRIWGIPHVKTKWTFTLDSDEVCSDPLREKIIEILKSGDETHDGYLFLIRTQIFGKLLKHQDLLSSRGKRLVMTKHATRYWRPARVHAQLRLDNKKEMPAKYYIIHNPIGSFSDHFRKMARYSRWQAQDMFDAGKRARWWHFTLRPVGKFLQFYIIKGGFRDGIEGLVVCALGAVNVAMKHIILAEMNHEAGRR